MTEKATLAMGCFWGPEAFFKKIPGVVDTTVGYTGGRVENPTYFAVCAGNTGHTEALEVVFDIEKITYGEILDLFWKHHDPSAYHRQGPDIGEQYRAAIFYHNESQKKEAEASKQRFLERTKFSKQIETEIVEATVFYPAEEYHQDYGDKNTSFVCHI